MVALKTRMAWTPSEVAHTVILLLATRAPSSSGTVPPQLIVFMALAKGRSQIRTGAVTLHTQTAIHIAEQLTQVGVNWSDWSSTALMSAGPVKLVSFQAKFTITKCEDEKSSNVTFIIECEGSGVTNRYL